MTIQERTSIVRPFHRGVPHAGLLLEYDREPAASAEDRSAEDRALTAALVPIERYRGRRLVAQGRPVKLHLGCGGTYLRGWINIDTTLPRGRRDLRWDLRRGLPLPDGVVESIFTEHLLEHLDLRDGL